jgi:hypothetical protein
VWGAAASTADSTRSKGRVWPKGVSSGDAASAERSVLTAVGRLDRGIDASIEEILPDFQGQGVSPVI